MTIQKLTLRYTAPDHISRDVVKTLAAAKEKITALVEQALAPYADIPEDITIQTIHLDLGRIRLNTFNTTFYHRLRQLLDTELKTFFKRDDVQTYRLARQREAAQAAKHRQLVGGARATATTTATTREQTAPLWTWLTRYLTTGQWPAEADALRHQDLEPLLRKTWATDKATVITYFVQALYRPEVRQRMAATLSLDLLQTIVPQLPALAAGWEAWQTLQNVSDPFMPPRHAQQAAYKHTLLQFVTADDELIRASLWEDYLYAEAFPALTSQNITRYTRALLSAADPQQSIDFSRIASQITHRLRNPAPFMLDGPQALRVVAAFFRKGQTPAGLHPDGWLENIMNLHGQPVMTWLRNHWRDPAVRYQLAYHVTQDLRDDMTHQLWRQHDSYQAWTTLRDRLRPYGRLQSPTYRALVSEAYKRYYDYLQRHGARWDEVHFHQWMQTGLSAQPETRALFLPGITTPRQERGPDTEQTVQQLLHIIRTYYHTGHFPDHAQTLRPSDLEPLVHQLLQLQRGPLVDYLAQALYLPATVTRLAETLSFPTLQEIIDYIEHFSWATEEWQFWEHYIGPDERPPIVNATAHKQWFLRFMREPQQSVRIQMATDYMLQNWPDTDPAEFSHAWRHVMNNRDKDDVLKQPLEQEMQQVDAHLKEAQAAHHQRQAQDRAHLADDDLTLLLSQLRRLTTDGTNAAHTLPDTLTTLLKKRRADLLTLLHTYWPEDRVRHTLANHSSLPQLGIITHQLWKRHASYPTWRRFWQAFEQVRQADGLTLTERDVRLLYLHYFDFLVSGQPAQHLGEWLYINLREHLPFHETRLTQLLQATPAAPPGIPPPPPAPAEAFTVDQLMAYLLKGQAPPHGPVLLTEHITALLAEAGPAITRQVRRHWAHQPLRQRLLVLPPALRATLTHTVWGQHPSYPLWHDFIQRLPGTPTETLYQALYSLYFEYLYTYEHIPGRTTTFRDYMAMGVRDYKHLYPRLAAYWQGPAGERPIPLHERLPQLPTEPGWGHPASMQRTWDTLLAQADTLWPALRQTTYTPAQWHTIATTLTPVQRQHLLHGLTTFQYHYLQQLLAELTRWLTPLLPPAAVAAAEQQAYQTLFYQLQQQGPAASKHTLAQHVAQAIIPPHTTPPQTTYPILAQALQPITPHAPIVHRPSSMVHGPSSIVPTEATRYDLTDLILYYLQTGAFPPWAAAQTVMDLRPAADQHLRASLSAQPPWWFDYLHTPQAARRMKQLLSPTVWHTLAQHLANPTVDLTIRITTDHTPTVTIHPHTPAHPHTPPSTMDHGPSTILRQRVTLLLYYWRYNQAPWWADACDLIEAPQNPQAQAPLKAQVIQHHLEALVSQLKNQPDESTLATKLLADLPPPRCYEIITLRFPAVAGFVVTAMTALHETLATEHKALSALPAARHTVIYHWLLVHHPTFSARTFVRQWLRYLWPEPTQRRHYTTRLTQTLQAKDEPRFQMIHALLTEGGGGPQSTVDGPQSLGDEVEDVDANVRGKKTMEEMGDDVVSGGSPQSTVDGPQSLGDEVEDVDANVRGKKTADEMGDDVMRGGSPQSIVDSPQSLGDRVEDVDAMVGDKKTADEMGDDVVSGRSPQSTVDGPRRLGDEVEDVDANVGDKMTADEIAGEETTDVSEKQVTDALADDVTKGLSEEQVADELADEGTKGLSAEPVADALADEGTADIGEKKITGKVTDEETTDLSDKRHVDALADEETTYLTEENITDEITTDVGEKTTPFEVTNTITPDTAAQVVINDGAHREQIQAAVMSYIRFGVLPWDADPAMVSRETFITTLQKELRPDNLAFRLALKSLFADGRLLDAFVHRADAAIVNVIRAGLSGGRDATFVTWQETWSGLVAQALRIDRTAADRVATKTLLTALQHKPPFTLAAGYYMRTALERLFREIPTASPKKLQDQLGAYQATAHHPADVMTALADAVNATIENKRMSLLQTLLKPEATKTRQRSTLPGDLQKLTGQVPVQHAGLVILGPFLYRYFDMLNMLTGNAFKTDAHARRAVYLLHFIVAGTTDEPPTEAQLLLPNILCGLDPLEPLDETITLTDEEIKISESLLHGVLGNWDRLKSKSIDALREGFLQREGLLEEAETGWKLTVERKAMDILVDLIPWSFSMIKLAWMPKSLATTWQLDEYRSLLR